MELEELKQQWREATTNRMVPSPVISELMQRKISAPLDKLKRTFRKSLVLVPAIFIYFIIFFSGKHDLFSQLLMWAYIVICILLSVYFYINFRLLNAMQKMDHPVMATLEKQVSFLETGIKWRLIIFRSVFILFPLVLELVMYFNKNESSITRWQHHSIRERILWYTTFFALFYFMSKYMIRYKYLKPVQQLKEILKQAE
ncbi:MAG: hypothetical protein JWN76_3472 [Chitinophagaceae bacterium]|nr:hypothetical protein [Chitinophagaceae bacterium]